MKYLLLLILVFACVDLNAHPMPNSILLLDVKSNGVSAELHWPLKEFQFVFPNEDIDRDPNTLIEREGAWLDSYQLAHMRVSDMNGHSWTISINSKKVVDAQQSFTGPYSELIFQLWLQAPPGVSAQHFTMNYDAIMHQVVTHKMLIRIRQDWDGGLSAQDSLNADLGMLMVNPARWH